MSEDFDKNFPFLKELSLNDSKTLQRLAVLQPKIIDEFTERLNCRERETRKDFSKNFE